MKERSGFTPLPRHADSRTSPSRASGSWSYRGRSRAHVLVAEQLDLLSDDQTKAAYRRIDPNVLGELCVMLFHFRGMDSIANNLPFLSDGRIGFIDTEPWDRSTSKPYLHDTEGSPMTKSRSPLTSEQIQRALDETKATLPILSLLGELFTDSKMFGSFDRFRSAGFDLVDHAETKIMSGSHKRAKGYLFKKYNNDKPGKKQQRNYMHRIEGAQLIRTFIAEHGFSRVAAPKKWLYELPSSFPERYLLVAEKVQLVSRSDTERKYGNIGKERMHELATILYYFRGLNSTAANLPYTEDGRIAFIDTERWHHDKDLLRKVGDRLSSDRRKQAEDVHRELRRQGAKPFASAFK